MENDLKLRAIVSSLETRIKEYNSDPKIRARLLAKVKALIMLLMMTDVPTDDPDLSEVLRIVADIHDLNQPARTE